MIRFREFLLLFIFSCLLSSTIEAQLNVKVGYNLGFTQLDKIDNILERFNEESTWLDKRFKTFNIVNGLSLGFRYRFSSTAIEVGIYNRFKNVEAEGTDPATNSSFFRKIGLQSRGLSIGLEQFIGMFSFGASIDRDVFVLRSKRTSSGDFSDLINVTGWSNHIYVAFNTPSSNFLSLSIRPYVQIPVSSFKVDTLEENLGYAPSGSEDRFLNFGVQIIFFNGIGR